MKDKKFWLSLLIPFSGVIILGLVLSAFLLTLFSQQLPNAESIRGVELKIPLRVYSSDGLLISEFGDERRKPLAYEDFPQSMVDAVLASEDDRFFEHGGIDFSGLVRAAISNARSGSSGQGASTITMQVARNFFLTRDKTYTRKIKEILLAFRLEQILSKQEILSLYLNKIFLGHRSYGFGAAAETYYGQELEALNIAQIAMLAGLPKAPSAYNPLRNPERAKIRRDYVISRLNELGKLTNEEALAAKSAPITAQKNARKSDLAAPHIAEMVRAELTSKIGEDAYWRGLNVHTTIVSDQQLHAQASLRKGLQAYDRRHGFRGQVGKIDLDSILEESHNSGAESLDPALERALSIYPTSVDQYPAITLSVSDTDASMWLSEFGEVKLDLKYARWAKRHKTADLVGDRPKKMQEILAAGDVVYLKQIEVKEAEAENAQTTTVWSLSQIPNVGGALISMNPQTGALLSLVGGYDFFLNKYNRAVQSIRQPGSNIKPFIYSASLDQGFTPASMISGAPIVITDPAHGTVWRPENYSGQFYGPTRMRDALGKSMNLVSIRLLRSIGIPYARQYTERFGIDMNRFSASLTMALGSGGVTPLDMLSAYGVIANGGYRVKPYFIEKITDREGEIIYLADQARKCDECYLEYLPKPEVVEENSEGEEVLADPVESTSDDATLDQTELEEQEQASIDAVIKAKIYDAPRVMSRTNNFLTVSMMRDVINRGTARKALALNRQDLAGKTGTTNDYVDAWFTGFNSQVVTTVWVGFDEPRSMGRGEAGSLTALPIWVDYMSKALKGIKQDRPDVPAYIGTHYVNRTTGEESFEDEPGAIAEYYALEELTPEYQLWREQYPELVLEDNVENLSEGSLTDMGFDDETGQEIPGQALPELPKIIENEDENEDLF